MAAVFQSGCLCAPVSEAATCRDAWVCYLSRHANTRQGTCVCPFPGTCHDQQEYLGVLLVQAHTNTSRLCHITYVGVFLSRHTLIQAGYMGVFFSKHTLTQAGYMGVFLSRLTHEKRRNSAPMCCPRIAGCAGGAVPSGAARRQRLPTAAAAAGGQCSSACCTRGGLPGPYKPAGACVRAAAGACQEGCTCAGSGALGPAARLGLLRCVRAAVQACQEGVVRIRPGSHALGCTPARLVARSLR